MAGLEDSGEREEALLSDLAADVGVVGFEVGVPRCGELLLFGVIEGETDRLTANPCGVSV